MTLFHDWIVERIISDVAELPDRTSSDDWPEAMLVTIDELRDIILAALSTIPSETIRAQRDREIVAWLRSYKSNVVREGQHVTEFWADCYGRQIEAGAVQGDTPHD